jgi:prepilin-type N-terminal cleavage/methylation domain-containing protein
MKKNQGFTLIEMLIVIAIIAVLSGIVLVGVVGFQASARDAKRVATLRSAQNAIELYYAQCGFYPGLADCVDGQVTSWTGLIASLSSFEDVDKFPAESDSDVGAIYGYSSCALDGGAAGSMQRYTVGVELEKGNAAAVNDETASCSVAGITCSNTITFCASE